MPPEERDPAPLDIGILAYNLDDMRPGGIDYYSFHLIKNLLATDRTNRYFLIHGEPNPFSRVGHTRTSSSEGEGPLAMSGG